MRRKVGWREILAASADQIAAFTHGTESYTTVFERHGNALEMQCSCPAFAKYMNPCKHLVALAISLTLPEWRRRREETISSKVRLRRYLESLQPERLIDLILETAEAGPSETAAVLKKAISGAIRTRGFVDYRQISDWAAKVDAVIDQMRDSVRSGPTVAQAVVTLVPYLVGRLEKAVENCDDDGHIGLLFDQSIDLLGAAAEAAQPDGESLACLLFDLDMDSDYFDLGDPRYKPSAHTLARPDRPSTARP